MDRGECDDAIAHFERVRAIRPKDPINQFHLGEAHRRAGSLTAALRNYKKACRLRPDFAEAYARMGDAYRGLDRVDEATAALSIRPDLPGCLNGLGLLAQRRGDLAQAIAHFQAAISVMPAGNAKGMAPLWANLGMIRLEAGAGPEGLEALGRSSLLRA